MDRASPAATGVERMRSYNLFYRKGLDGLVCAVPEDYAVPSFLTEDLWAFEGRVDGRTPQPAGFDGSVAATAVRFNGFYLFQNLARTA